jgi:hypothetical protein
VPTGSQADSQTGVPTGNLQKFQKFQSSTSCFYLFQVPRQQCQQVPKQTPKQECRQVPRQQCQQVPKQECRQEPRQKCQQVPREKCQQVPRQACQQVPRQECRQEPRQRCQKVLHSIIKVIEQQMVNCILLFRFPSRSADRFPNRTARPSISAKSVSSPLTADKLLVFPQKSCNPLPTFTTTAVLKQTRTLNLLSLAQRESLVFSGTKQQWCITVVSAIFYCLITSLK